MKFSPEIIKAAYDQHLRVYAEGRRKWDVPSHIRLWNKAEYAFNNSSVEHFERDIYEELRRNWQVFRGSEQFASPRFVFDLLTSSCVSVRRIRLSEITSDNVAPIWEAINAMCEIKLTRAGPSVMAISKFLHFWNPRLFVIVDDGVMRRWVLQHSWIKEQLRSTHANLVVCFHNKEVEWTRGKCDLTAYLSLLVWAGHIIRENLDIALEFVNYLKRHQGTLPFPRDIGAYEAAAMEWFLMGLVEINPSTSH